MATTRQDNIEIKVHNKTSRRHSQDKTRPHQRQDHTKGKTTKTRFCARQNEALNDKDKTKDGKSKTKTRQHRRDKNKNKTRL